MKLLVSLAASLMIAFAPMSSAMAAAVSKSEIMEILTSQGFNAQDYGPNRVRINVGGYAVIVLLNGADGDVTYITWPGVNGDSVSYKFLNNFNNEVKFGRAYVDGDGDVTIQMDRNASGGVTSENIESDFDVFLLLISKFLSDLEAQAVA